MKRFLLMIFGLWAFISYLFSASDFETNLASNCHHLNRNDSMLSKVSVFPDTIKIEIVNNDTLAHYADIVFYKQLNDSFVFITNYYFSRNKEIHPHSWELIKPKSKRIFIVDTNWLLSMANYRGIELAKRDLLNVKIYQGNRSTMRKHEQSSYISEFEFKIQ